MANELYHQLNPLIRLKEKELLSQEIFQQLIEAENFQKIAEILQPTIYGQYIANGFELTFENALTKELTQTVAELKEITPEPAIIWIYTLRYTFHNLKVLTKGYVAEQNFEHLFIYDGFYSLENLKNAIQTGHSSVLPPEIMEAIQTVKAYFEESSILQGIDIIYDRSYLKTLREVSKRYAVPELEQSILSFIDLTNMITAARCILQQRSRGFMEAVLSGHGSIDKEAFLDYSGRSLAEFISFMRTSDYSEVINDALTEETIDFATLDLLKDDLQTQLFSTGQTQAFGPLPLLAFLTAKDIEVQNLRLIVVGKRSNFTKQQIKERMRKIA